MRDNTNNYWEQLERLEKLIKAAELKAGVIFSYHSLILGLFVDRFENFEEAFQDSVIFTICFIIWLLLVLISIYYCFRCFKPNMELKYDKNVFFFRDAVYKFGSIKEYSKTLRQICATDKSIVKQLSEQIHAESVIIEKKFYDVKKAIQFFILSFIAVIISFGAWISFSIS